MRLLRQRLAAGAQRLVREDRTLRRASAPPQAELLVHINAQGIASEVLIRKSSGFAALDDLAVRSVRLARFRPSLLNNCPQPVWVPFPLGFQLR